MNRRVSTGIALGVCLAASTAWAHHNMTALFDFNDRVTFTGTLSKLDWGNPHIYLYVEAKNAAGQMETWAVEGPAPSFFRAHDFSKSDFATVIGKSVTVEASRARDHSLTGLLRILTLPDGRLVSACPQNC